MADNSGGSSLFGRVVVALLVIFIVGLFFAPEIVSAKFFRALNSLADGAGPWTDSPKVGMVIVSIALIYLVVRVIRGIQ